MYVNMTHIKQADSFCYYSRNWAKLKISVSTWNVIQFRSAKWIEIRSSVKEASPAPSMTNAINVNVDDLDDQ